MTGLPLAPGAINYQGNASNSAFGRDAFSPLMQEKLYPQTVAGDICNRDYEGDFKIGATQVTIRTKPTVNVGNLSLGGEITNQTNFDSAKKILYIDRYKYTSVELDHVQEASMDVKLWDELSIDAAKQMAISIDSDILVTVPPKVHASNAGLTAGLGQSIYNLGVSGTPFAVTPANIMQKISDCMTVLSLQHVKRENRYMVIPLFMENYLLNSDLKWASLTGDSTSTLRNGKIGTLLGSGLDIYVSDNMTAVADGSGVTAYNVIFGHKMAISFAAQVTNSRLIELPTRNARAMQSFSTYGVDVVKSEAVGNFYVTNGI